MKNTYTRDEVILLLLDSNGTHEKNTLTVDKVKKYLKEQEEFDSMSDSMSNFNPELDK